MQNAADSAFEATLNATYPTIRAYIAGMGVPVSDIDDLAQDVYVEFYKSGRTLPPDTPPARWLKGIARNLCNNYFRRQKRRGEHMMALAEIMERTPSGGAYDTTEPGVMKRVLDGCLEKLSRPHRRMLDMRYGENRPAGAIARAVRSTEKAVRVTLFRLRKILKECIDLHLRDETA